MFDCVGYVFGSGLVFCIEKKKKERKREQEKKKERKQKGERGRGREIRKNRATFAVFNLLSGGQAQLTVLTSGHLKIKARAWLLSLLSPGPPFMLMLPKGDFYPSSPVSGSLTAERWG